MLETALAAGYAFVDFAQVGREPGSLSCLLRHDVDSELLHIGPMADIESALGVRATYFLMLRSTAYNLLSVEATAMVKRLLAGGHRLGLHFMGEVLNPNDRQGIVAAVQKEVAFLQDQFETSIAAVSYHQPSPQLIENNIAFPNLINTYHRQQLQPYFYASDTNMHWRYEHPSEMFRRRLHPRLQLLIHPMWWTEQACDLHEKWRLVLRNNRRAVIAHWLQRERTLVGVDLGDAD